jgi:hypothetical protein
MDLELLHNYDTATASTLHTDPALKVLWKINVSEDRRQDKMVSLHILTLSGPANWIPIRFCDERDIESFGPPFSSI